MKLTTVKIQNDQPTVAESTHRVIVIDCSGSMSNDLPKLRTHLKNKIPTLVQPDDVLSIIWFSSKNQFGTLFEAVKISSLTDLSNVNSTIDRFVKPVSMTAFKQPLEEVIRLAKAYPMPIAMNFFSDGQNNDGTPTKDILKVCESLSDLVASATFVEYSHYADSKMLQQMAEAAGGSVVLAEDFNSYTEVLNKTMNTMSSGKKIKIKNIKVEFVVGNLPDGFVVAKPDAVGTVTLPANTSSYSLFEGYQEVPESIQIDDLSVTPYMVAALIQRGSGDLALTLAGSLGDVSLYKKVENAFSKQDYARLVELSTELGSGKQKLFSEPRNTNLIPDANAYNVLTMLMDLADEEGNYLDISHPDFVYSAIGDSRSTVPDANGFVPKFTDATKEIKGAISALKFDEDRPNISILVKRKGTVSLPENEHGFSDVIDSFIWRNYTIVRDGIVNLKKIPVILSKASYDLLKQNGVIDEPFKVGKTFVIDTTKMPIINRSMVEVGSAVELGTKCFKLYSLKAKQKFLNSKLDKPEVSEKFASLYGLDGALFLKQYGVTEGGFSPKTEKSESVDPYMAKVFEVKMSGFSSIPKIEDVEKNIAAKKSLTVSQQVVSNALNDLNNITLPDDLKLKAVKDNIKALSREITMTKFGVILGKKFPTGITMENNSVDIDVGLSKPITCQFNLVDKEI